MVYSHIDADVYAHLSMRMFRHMSIPTAVHSLRAVEAHRIEQDELAHALAISRTAAASPPARDAPDVGESESWGSWISRRVSDASDAVLASVTDSGESDLAKAIALSAAAAPVGAGGQGSLAGESEARPAVLTQVGLSHWDTVLG